ncbi:hypothetical protein VB779_05865 [Haloarculaceae archaeon H-GB11]|nr:hypothetical protein [Haloarculaceae archaeon H-GB11]
MVQYDCPYVDTTDETDVSFHATQWDFNPASEELETRIMVSGADRAALDDGLGTLRNHQNMRGYDLLRRQGDVEFHFAPGHATGFVDALDGQFGPVLRLESEDGGRPP